MKRRDLLRQAGALSALATLPGAYAVKAFAQSSFPSGSIALIVPYPPGGTADAQARAIADFLTTQFSHPTIVENVEGASGIVANRRVHALPPDGQTLILQTSSAMIVVPQLSGEAYEPRELLRPVANVYNHPIAIITGKNSPYKTIQDVIDDAKKRPGEIKFASPGVNSMYHMAGEILNKKADIQLLHVPYKGAAQYTVDLIAGRIELAIGTLATAMTNSEVRPLLVGTPKRSTVNPDVQTAVEAGFPELVLPSESGVFTHVDTPDESVQLLSDAVGKMMSDENAKAALADLKLEFNFLDHKQFAEALEREHAMISQLISETGMKRS
ncbi:tripartite tricarboxylate transporter substrate binding protein [Corticibacterium sp. UT-5YL-CI-8]|nr:tripartite tricarboxylate transporter substrate binding protein [Tianweitania sp. UT-5YL-CI-8]